MYMKLRKVFLTYIYVKYWTI